jgi:hypothetical protein
MINTRVVTDFPLCDQEILLRHLHMTAWNYVNAYTGNGIGSGASEATGETPANGNPATTTSEKDAAHV